MVVREAQELLTNNNISKLFFISTPHTSFHHTTFACGELQCVPGRVRHCDDDMISIGKSRLVRVMCTSPRRHGLDDFNICARISPLAN
jgi:hypothetical protein